MTLSIESWRVQKNSQVLNIVVVVADSDRQPWSTNRCGRQESALNHLLITSARTCGEGKDRLILSPFIGACITLRYPSESLMPLLNAYPKRVCRLIHSRTERAGRRDAGMWRCYSLRFDMRQEAPTRTTHDTKSRWRC
jgi:hypothetical protein